jgi:hypothetical protein
MSSDCCYVRIGEIAGDRVVLHCLTGFAGGLTDLFTSRSFALTLLLDAKSRAGDVEYDVHGAPPEIAAERIALAERTMEAPSALHDELANPEPWDTAWHQRNVPRVINRRPDRRHNALTESSARSLERSSRSKTQARGPTSTPRGSACTASISKWSQRIPST